MIYCYRLNITALIQGKYSDVIFTPNAQNSLLEKYKPGWHIGLARHFISTLGALGRMHTLRVLSANSEKNVLIVIYSSHWKKQDISLMLGETSTIIFGLIAHLII